MYASYEATSLWQFLRRPVAGARISFVRAEGSNYRWAGGDEQRITALGHDVHLLRQAGASCGIPGVLPCEVCTIGRELIEPRRAHQRARPQHPPPAPSQQGVEQMRLHVSILAQARPTVVDRKTRSQLWYAAVP